MRRMKLIEIEEKNKRKRKKELIKRYSHSLAITIHFTLIKY